mgnify:FL=1
MHPIDYKCILCFSADPISGLSIKFKSEACEKSKPQNNCVFEDLDFVRPTLHSKFF